ncbi:MULTISPECIES: type III secretion protein [unclassified Brenneria]|uniref:type III secretion protein n=1 Tax=unclassified Brenneria TaxID=2634434 RepID=UPI001557D980|nr:MULTISPECIES: type III secretion protein [unclassified Brenneria]MBJ7220900.1 type III secretion protein [Brenneria sp. L3-3C-1]MEE3642141.1 type III secretion protein [Brenneria sp. L3_3C_1]MEE3650486.1 type III secretion protein [Brenneria sp. HEZEL_4_2_4]NPD00442.1 type III secretion protein [Brenneria sp. hezel4-2-4]
MPHNLPEADALQATLNLLMPIRRQRLSRSERQLRQEEQTLNRLDAEQAAHRQRLDALQLSGRQQRDAFVSQMQGRQQTQENLKKRLHDEQRLLHDIHAETQRGESNRVAQQNQQQQVKHARQTTRQCQKAVEKLEFLLTLPQENL